MQAQNMKTLHKKRRKGTKVTLLVDIKKVTLAKAAPAKRRGIRVIVLRVTKPAV